METSKVAAQISPSHTNQALSNIAYDAIIIGGGACGLMCAMQAGYRKKRVLLLESQEKVGKKISISGGGRCNYTNLHTSAKHFISKNPHFCKSALNAWPVASTRALFKKFGIQGAEKTLGQLFPIKHKGKDIVAFFRQACLDLNQTIIVNAPATAVAKTSTGYAVTAAGKVYQAPKLVLACGGKAIPAMGASDFALVVAKQFGLPVTPVAPALVPLTLSGADLAWCESLSGIALRARVSYGKIAFDENILFTHWGLSGPAILQLSSYLPCPASTEAALATNQSIITAKQGITIYMDFLPDKDITAFIQQARAKNGKTSLRDFLRQFFSLRMIDSWADKIPLNKPLAELNKANIAKIKHLAHGFSCLVTGNKGYEKAEVMRGGIHTKVICSKTLEAKPLKGLYIGGECLDVTGWLGGYNFQWAWASGYVIAQQI